MVAVIMLAACSTCWPSRALDHPVLQRLFGRVLAAVGAMKLPHAMEQMVAGRHSLRQLGTVVVNDMLAAVRELIVLGVETASGLVLIDLAAAVRALGGVLPHRIGRRLFDAEGREEVVTGPGTD